MKWIHLPNPLLSIDLRQQFIRASGNNRKNLRAFIVTLVAAWLLLAVPVQAQFQRVFGTALDESFSKVVQNGANYYVLGSGEITDGQPPRATISSLNAVGELGWTLSLNTASVWKDAVLMPSGNLLVVGHSLPEGANSKSIMGSVTAAGTFAWVRYYDNFGSDAFLKVVKNPSPQNPSFPYYVLGSQTDAMTMFTDMVLLNVDGLGNVNYLKLYTNPIFFSGNKYGRDLEALPNGDLLIAVNFETQGIVMRTNNAGQPFGGAAPEFPFSIIDLALGDGGDFYAVGKASQSNAVHLMKFNDEMIGLWDYTISGAAEVSQVLHAPSNGDIYLSGKRTMTVGPSVFWLTENDNTPELVAVKLLNGNATAQSGGTLSLLSGSQIAFADGRSILTDNFGQLCGFVSVTGMDLNSCVASNSTAVLHPENTLFNGPELPEANFYEIPTVSNLTGSARTWQQGNACSATASCVADFNFNFPNCDPTVSFTNTSSGPAPLSYSWDFGLTVLGIPQTSVAANPFYTFPAQCGTYNVCLTVTGSNCSNTLCKTVVIKYPQSPVFTCPPDITVRCNTSIAPATTGFATLTGACSGVAPNITYSDAVSGTMPCDGTVHRTWSVTDECGQAHTCVQIIRVIDNIQPTLTNCPQNVTVTGITGSDGICSGNVFVTSPTATDNCDLSVTLVNNFNNTANASGAYPMGTTPVTWTATDDCGNTRTCNFTVTVNCSTTICCPEFSLVQLEDIRPCPGDLSCRGDSGVHAPDGLLEIRRSIACKNSLQSYYVVPGLPGFSYSWMVTGGTPTSLTGNPGVITWGNGSQGLIQVFITDSSGMCRDTLTQEVCLLDSPTAAFTVLPATTVCTNQLVNFSNTSTGGNIYHWDFGDGTSSSAQHPPAHSYSAPGTYTVVLTVSNGATEFQELPCGCVDTATAIITVVNGTGPSITSLNCKQMLCPRDTITYFVSPGCAPYNWTVNGGTIIANNGASITVDWNQSPPATFPAYVSVTTGCGGQCGNSATLNVPVLWNNIPINGPNPVCVGATATYTLPTMPGTFYTWNVTGAGGVIISPSLNTPSITVNWGNAPGVGTITCAYTNPFSGCSGNTTLMVNVKGEFTIAGPSQACVGVPANVYNVSSGGTANWTVSPGIAGTHYTLSPATGISTSINWLIAGTYTVTATPANPGPATYCNPSEKIIVTVSPAPVLNTIGGPIVVCPNQLYTYTASSNLPGGNFVWSLSNPLTGTISPYGPNNSSASVSFTGSGPWTLMVTQTVNNCPGTKTLVITKEPVPALPPAPITACIGGQTTVTVLPSSNGPYTWSTSPAVSLVSGQGTATATYEIHATGTITVANCSGTSNIINVTKTNPPAIVITKTGSLCTNNLQLQAPAGGTLYQWIGGGTSISPTIIGVNKPGPYTVKVTYPDGCISVATYTVAPEVIPTVAISTGDPLGWCLTTTPSVLLQAYTQSIGCSYQWYKYNSSNPVGTNSPTYTATSAGSYYVVVTCGGCFATSNTITVSQFSCPGGGAGGCVGVNPFGAITEVAAIPITTCNPKTFTVNVAAGCSSNPVQWNFGDGSPIVTGVYTSAGVNSVTHTYATPGAYLVRAIISCNGCDFTSYTNVNVPLVADFLYSVQCGANGANTITMINASQTLGGWNVTSKNWTTSCGTPTTPSTGDTYVFNTTSTCNPTVTLTMTVTDPATGKVCIDSKSFTFNFATVPLTITGPAVVCKNQIYPFSYTIAGPNILHYQWTVNGVPVSQEATLLYAFDGNPVNPVVGLTLTDDLGCTYTATKPVTVVTPRPLTLAPLAICQDCLPPATLSATPATGFTNYQWYQNGLPVGPSTATYQLCQFNASGNYYVTAIDSQNNNCLVKSNTVQVVYHPKPTANIQGETVQCRPAGGPYTIALANVGGSPNPNYLYNWTAAPAGSVTFNPNNLYNANATVTQPGEYQFVLTVTDITTGCMARDTFCVYVYLNPTVTITGPGGILCEGTPYTFSATATPPANYAYVWSNGVTGATMTTSQAGFYTVTATNEESGCFGVANSLFHIRETPSTILFPVGCDTICDTGTITPPLVPNAAYTVQWFVNGFPTSFFTGPTLSLTGNVVPPLVYGFNDIYIVVTYQGCSDTSNVYNLFIRECCECTTSLTLLHGDDEYALSCDPHVGFIPSLSCPVKDVTVFGHFGFVDPTTGEPCEETEVIWELVKPDLSTTGGITTNFTSFLFLKDSIADPGLYCLNLMTISADGLDTCVCKISWIQEPCVCCTSMEEFCETLENNITLSVDQALCTATLNIGNFNGCGTYIDWIDWNYPSVQQGPYPPGSAPTHTYTSSGTYTVCYLAIEIGDDGLICNEKLVCETITVECPNCYCGTFSTLFFPLNRNVQGSPASCGGPEITLDCPAPGRSIQLTGLFQCAGPNCPPTAQVSWQLYRLPNTTTPVASSSTTANPYFAINILPSWYATPGSYELRLVGHCGAQECPCIIRFRVDCPDPCPCDEVALSKAVKKGFTSATSNLACRACFSPVALNDCDSVSWHIGNVNNPPIGTTFGNQTLCHTFAGSGTYTIFMVVTRRRADGTICAMAVRSRTVQVNCIAYPVCDESIFDNPGFNLGAEGGVLGSGGMSTNWIPAAGAPLVIEGAGGSLNAWTISLSGNFENTDALTPIEPICLERDTGIILLRAKDMTSGGRPRPCDRIVVGLQSDWILDDDLVIATIALDALEWGEWYDIEIPYDLADYPEVDACGSSMLGALVQPVVYVTNALVEEQGGVETHSSAQVDYLCFEGQLLTKTDDPKQGHNVYLYPNPTTGELTLRFDGTIPPKGQVQLLDLYGRVVQQEPLVAGRTASTFNVATLPGGIYFVKLLDGGVILWTGKVIKQ